MKKCLSLLAIFIVVTLVSTATAQDKKVVIEDFIKQHEGFEENADGGKSSRSILRKSTKKFAFLSMKNSQM